MQPKTKNAEGQHDEGAEAEEAGGHGAGENLEDYEDRDPSVTPAVLRRLSIDSTWQLLQSTNVAAGDEAARRRAWMENALLLVQVSSSIIRFVDFDGRKRIRSHKPSILSLRIINR